MSQRRLLAFVSSRMAELAPERKIVKAELDKLHVDAWVFETDAGARAQASSKQLKEVEAAASAFTLSRALADCAT